LLSFVGSAFSNAPDYGGGGLPYARGLAVAGSYERS
jgi:hypothetical protein